MCPLWIWTLYGGFFFFVSVCARASLMCVTADRRYCTGLCKANCSQMYCAINYRVFLSEATAVHYCNYPASLPIRKSANHYTKARAAGIAHFGCFLKLGLESKKWVTGWSLLCVRNLFVKVIFNAWSPVILADLWEACRRTNYISSIMLDECSNFKMYF